MKNKLSVFAALCALAALISASAQVVESARFALRLCVELILPSLFPFIVVTILLKRLGFADLAGRLLSGWSRRLFGVSGAGATALIMGLCGGYPLGALYIADMAQRGDISPGEAERLLAFCNNSGPAFIVGAVGAGVFHSPGVGILLYCAHAAAAVLTGLLLRREGRAEPNPPRPIQAEPFSSALPSAVRDGVSAVLNVCGFVVVFSVFASLLDVNGAFTALAAGLGRLFSVEPRWARALLTGLLELGGGVGAMQGLGPTPLNLALAAFITGFGGVSVHFQTLSAIADCKIKSGLHFTGRLMSGVFGGALAYALAVFFLRS